MSFLKNRIGLLPASIAIIGALSIAVFVRFMNYEMRRDEQLYVPPATLLSDSNLYSDFFYNHVPSSAWLFHAFHLLLPSHGVLFTSRLAVFVFWLIFAVSSYIIVWRLAHSAILALLTVFIVCANPLVLSASGMTATNNLLILPLILLGATFFVIGVDERHRRPQLVLLSGFFLALAGTFKVSALFFVPPVVVAAFILPKSTGVFGRFKSNVFPLAYGGLIGALPVFYYLLRVPDRFLAHIVGFHTGPHVDYWLRKTDGEIALAFQDKVLLAYQVWLDAAGVLMVFVVALLYAYVVTGRQARVIGTKIEGTIVLVGVLLLIAIGFSFFPTPSFPQYFLLPFAVLPLFIALLFRKIDPNSQGHINRVMTVVLAVVMLVAAPRLVQHLPKLMAPAKWSTAYVHKAGEKIRELVGPEGRVATLLPIYALEGGVGVYPEIATGQFAYRSAEITDAALRRHYKTTSPVEIAGLLRGDPPVGILIGFEPELEEPLLKFALENEYRLVEDFKLKDRYGDGRLYVRGCPISVE